MAQAQSVPLQIIISCCFLFLVLSQFYLQIIVQTGNDQQLLHFNSCCISILNESEKIAAYQKLTLLSDPKLDCHSLININSLSYAIKSKQVEKAKKWWPKPEKMKVDRLLNRISKNCTEFHQTFYFPPKPLSTKEAQFPLAYAMLVFDGEFQVLQLLQALYWPQNAYCIHIDQKSTEMFKKTIKSVIDCLPTNVVLAHQMENVSWGEYSVLKAAINCLETLERLKTSIPWKYAQIVAGVDFPLKTNREMVEIFQILNGTVDIDLLPPDIDRFVLQRSNKTQFNSIPPGNIRLYKGSFQASLPADFVKFVLHNPTSQMILKWLQTTSIPDEFYWSTMVHNLHLDAPGHFPGICLDYYKQEHLAKQWISRYQIFGILSSHYKFLLKSESCNGKFTFESCVYGVLDLNNLVNRKELFAHKLYGSYEPATLECLADWHYTKTYKMEQKTLVQNLNLTFYQSLPAVKFHKMPNKANFTCV